MLLRNRISKILVEWNMPTRQVAIDLLINEVRKDIIKEFEKENECYCGSYNRALDTLSKKYNIKLDE